MENKISRRRALRLWSVCAAFLLLALPARAYVLEGKSWTKDRTVLMQLSLGGNRILSDGATSFNQVAQDALNIWNPYLAHLKFAAVVDSPVPPGEYDDEMSVFFSSTIFGDTFGTDTLAVTLLSSRGSVMEETDTLFNTAFTWDSYRGPLRQEEDFRRVAIHEFGHTLGLDHPDQGHQVVAAIMNSRVSDIEVPQADDIAGVQSLYASGPDYQTWNDAPVLRNISTRASVGTGDNVLIGGFIIQGSQAASVILRAVGYSLREAGIANALQDPIITVYDANHKVVATNDDWITGVNAQTIASYQFDPSNSVESALYLTLLPGSYTAIVQGYSDSHTPAGTGVALFELYDLHTTSARAGNVSSRGQVLAGDGVMIGGFIVGGSAAKEVIVRALGPSLTDAGVNGALADPTLTLYDGNGNILQANDDWQQSPDAATISARGHAPDKPKESAIVATVAPGSYTAIVRGANNTTGIGLVEVFDTSAAPQ